MPDDAVQLFTKAVEQHSNGRLAEALTLYGSVIRLNPNIAAAHSNRGAVLNSLKRHEQALQSCDRAVAIDPAFADAWNNRGNALNGLKRVDDALQSYDRAIALTPDYPAALNNRGNALRSLNRPDEALQSYDRAIALQPDYADAHYNRGVTLEGVKRAEEALASYDRAIAINPGFAEARNGKGNSLLTLGRPSDAVASLQSAISLKSDYADAWSNLGNALSALNRLDEALQCYDRAIALKPDFAEAYYNRGIALKDMKRLDDALQSYDRTIALKPDHAEAHSNRGHVVQDMQRLDAALADYDRAIALKLDYPEAWNNRGALLRELKRFDEAIASFGRAIALKPDFAEAYWNKSLCLLLMGRMAEGFALYEWRHRRGAPIAPRTFPQPVWTGAEDIGGKRLFVHAEQGLGDTIQFCRYANLAEARGAGVTLSVQDSLVGLVRTLSSTIEVVDSKSQPREGDLQIALLSMPLAFGTDIDTNPAKVPYLCAEPERVRTWKDKIGSDGFKVGICWQGEKGGVIDVGRSFPLTHFAGLAKIPGVRLISLQKNTGAEQLHELPPGMVVETLGDDFDAGPNAFLDSAAVMENLDLVIASDTAIAHLAGALGRPVWVALKYVPDWRWLLDRADSRWYPTMRLFRQKSQGDWPGVFAEMKRELAKMVEAGAMRAAPRVPISWGELIDRLTILEIKHERIADEAARANVAMEMSLVREIAEPLLIGDPRIETLKNRLHAINEDLWRIENDIRAKEAAAAFDRDFIALARAVYLRNDERAAVKREIDLALGSELMEEKSYTRTQREKDKP
jgi:tetratricopeptide (TPR) repeat protein